MRIRLAPVLVSTLLLTVAGVSVAQEPKSRATPATTEGVLKAADIGAKSLFPRPGGYRPDAQCRRGALRRWVSGAGCAR